MKVQNSPSVQVQPQQKTDSKVKTFVKSNVAALAGSTAQLVAVPVGCLAVHKMSKASRTLSPENIEMVNQSAQNMVKSLGLDKHGVKIVDYRGKTSSNPIFDSFRDMITKGSNRSSKLSDSIRCLIDPVYATGKGKNAFFTDKAVIGVCGANSVVYNHEKMSLAAFHEIGHAFNRNKSKVWSMLQKMRTPAMAVATIIALVPAFTKTTKPQEGEELTKAQKFKNGIRNNAGKLAFATMIPVLAEEAMASIRGCKWANSNLPKEIAKKVLKTNAYGMASYVFAAVGLALSAVVARRVKDKLTANKTA